MGNVLSIALLTSPVESLLSRILSKDTAAKVEHVSTVMASKTRPLMSCIVQCAIVQPCNIPSSNFSAPYGIGYVTIYGM